MFSSRRKRSAINTTDNNVSGDFLHLKETKDFQEWVLLDSINEPREAVENICLC